LGNYRCKDKGILYVIIIIQYQGELIE